MDVGPQPSEFMAWSMNRRLYKLGFLCDTSTASVGTRIFFGAGSRQTATPLEVGLQTISKLDTVVEHLDSCQRISSWINGWLAYRRAR